MKRNTGKWRKTWRDNPPQPKVNKARSPTIRARQTVLQLSGLEASPWRTPPWPNALPPKPRWRSTSVRTKRKPTTGRRPERSAPSCLRSSQRGCRTTSWCWWTLFARTVFQRLSGLWAIGCATSTAQSIPCATPSATKPFGPPSGIFWCASGTKRRTSLNFRRGGLSRRAGPRARPSRWCLVEFSQFAGK